MREVFFLVFTRICQHKLILRLKGQQSAVNTSPSCRNQLLIVMVSIDAKWTGTAQYSLRCNSCLYQDPNTCRQVDLQVSVALSTLSRKVYYLLTIFFYCTEAGYTKFLNSQRATLYDIDLINLTWTGSWCLQKTLTELQPVTYVSRCQYVRIENRHHFWLFGCLAYTGRSHCQMVVIEPRPKTLLAFCHDAYVLLCLGIGQDVKQALSGSYHTDIWTDPLQIKNKKLTFPPHRPGC